MTDWLSMIRQLGVDMSDVDLTSNEAWEPVYNPYLGRESPQWVVTLYARWYMKWDHIERHLRERREHRVHPPAGGREEGAVPVVRMDAAPQRR